MMGDAPPQGLGRYALARTALLGANLAGAAIFAAALAALAVPAAQASLIDFLAAAIEKIPAAVLLDFGTSRISGLPAMEAAAPALQATFELFAIGAIVGTLLGVPLGLALAAAPTRRIAAPIVQLAGSVPLFGAALAAGMALAYLLPIAGPAADTMSVRAAFASADPSALAATLAAVAAPALTIGLAGAGAVGLALRNAVERAGAEPYRRGLRRLGIPKGQIFGLYVARRALALLLRDAGDIVLALFTAAAVAEWVSGWPGAGAEFVQAVALKDWPVAGAIVLVFAAVRFAADFIGALAFRLLGGEDEPA